MHPVLTFITGCSSWCSRRRFDYLFKADDDTYICTRDVVELLDERFGASTDMGAPRPESASSRCTYIGEQIHGKRAWLRPGLPWYDPHYPTVFNTTIYPDFMQGGGYILSHGAARAVVDMGKEVGLYSWRREAERMPHQEDVLVAELLRRGTANASLCGCPRATPRGECLCVSALRCDLLSASNCHGGSSTCTVICRPAAGGSKCGCTLSTSPGLLRSSGLRSGIAEAVKRGESTVNERLNK